MFQGNVAVPNVSEVDWDHVIDPVPDVARCMRERAMESRMGIMSAKCKGSKEKITQESPYGRELTVAIAVRWTPLNKTLVCPSYMRTKVKTVVWSAAALNWATQRLDETDLCSPARDVAERITATDIIVNMHIMN